MGKTVESWIEDCCVSIVSRRHEYSEDGRAEVLTLRVESARQSTAKIPGYAIRTPVPTEPLDIELRLPANSTRGELARVLEETARVLRDADL